MTLSFNSNHHSSGCLIFLHICICTYVIVNTHFSVINIAQILMSVREVQQSVIVLLTVLILMGAMCVHARLDSQEMDFSALVCIIVFLVGLCAYKCMLACKP